MAFVNSVQKPLEFVAIVDRHNNVVGSATRKEMREQNLMHRASFVMVFNSQGQLFVQKRVDFKETFPGFYDPAPGGVVGADETYESNAIKEVEEEMGITGVTLQHRFDFWHESDGLKFWGRLFSVVYDGEMVLQPEEVQSGSWHTLQEVKELLETAQPGVCPDSKQALRQYFAEAEAISEPPVTPVTLLN